MKKSWRKIVVNDDEYVWCLPDNQGYCDNHILIHLKSGSSNCQVLYVDITAWGVEIRPKTVRDAIKFGLANSWKPKEKGEGLYIGYNKDYNFIVLPPYIKFSYKIVS